MIAVGIDVGKRTHEACFLDARGRAIALPVRFANTAGGIRLLQERLPALPAPATEISAALEGSGHYRLGLHRCLRATGVPVQLVNPLQTSAFRTTGVR